MSGRPDCQYQGYQRAGQCTTGRQSRVVNSIVPWYLNGPVEALHDSEAVALALRYIRATGGGLVPRAEY
jgi:hypothetical protein